MATRDGLVASGKLTTERTRSWWRAGTSSSAGTFAPLAEELYSPEGQRLTAAVLELEAHARRLDELLGGRGA